MGRSPRNAAGRVENGAWEAVRRALGRLAMRAKVHLVPINVAPPETSAVPLSDGPDVFAGSAESAWRPAAVASELCLPGADSVVANADLADIAVTVNADASVAPPRIVFSSVLVSETNVNSYALLTVGASAPRVVGTEMGISEAIARAVRLISPTRCARLPIARIAAPRLIRRDVRTMIGGRVRPGLPTLAQVPWTRLRLPPPPDIPRESLWLVERQKLAAAANVPLADVRLIGIFPGVPVGAVRSLAFADDGASLQFWFKPAALGGPAPRLVTLILGQRRSTGEAIRAIA